MSNNIAPPPETDDIQVLRDWLNSWYEFMKNPAFQSFRLVPRATMATPQEGISYYDGDDKKEKVCTDSSVPTWEDKN